MRVRENAVLVPLHEASGHILVQDRRGHRPPPWGFFGGGLEAGETPLEALFREVREELTFTLSSAELIYLGEFAGTYGDLNLTLYAFLWPFGGTLSKFRQTEGAGMELVTADEMLGRTEPGGPDHTLARAVKGVLYARQAAKAAT